MCLALYVSTETLTPRTDVPLFISFFVVPVATVASILPLPGGEGGVETALVLLLVPVTGIPVAVATSASIVYRLGTYWVGTFMGGSAALYLERDTLIPIDDVSRNP